MTTQEEAILLSLPYLLWEMCVQPSVAPCARVCQAEVLNYVVQWGR